MTYEYLFLISLGITIFLEFLVLFVYSRVWRRDIPGKNIVIASSFLSFSTLPYLWFIFSLLGKGGYMSGEVFATVIEGFLLYSIFTFSVKESILLSLIMNLFSFFIGKEILSFITM